LEFVALLKRLQKNVSAGEQQRSRSKNEVNYEMESRYRGLNGAVLIPKPGSGRNAQPGIAFEPFGTWLE